VKSDYVFFYLEGREAKLLKADIDTGVIAEQVIADKGTIHELLHAAVSAAAKGLEVDRQKKRWISDYEDEIAAAGGDSDAAYRHFCDGRIDELVYRLEPEVLEDLEVDDDDDEGDDDDEDGAEDDEDGKDS
jgi:hypothetical protein